MLLLYWSGPPGPKPNEFDTPGPVPVTMWHLLLIIKMAGGPQPQPEAKKTSLWVFSEINGKPCRFRIKIMKNTTVIRTSHTLIPPWHSYQCVAVCPERKPQMRISEQVLEKAYPFLMKRSAGVLKELLLTGLTMTSESWGSEYFTTTHGMVTRLLLDGIIFWSVVVFCLLLVARLWFNHVKDVKDGNLTTWVFFFLPVSRFKTAAVCLLTDGLTCRLPLLSADKCSLCSDYFGILEVKQHLSPLVLFFFFSSQDLYHNSTFHYCKILKVWFRPEMSNIRPGGAQQQTN